MKNDQIFITIDHLDDYGGARNFRIDDELILKKDKDNPYDDEAIIVSNKRGMKCGYVANSVHTVARGTYSSGRIYEKIGDDALCKVRFIIEDMLIAQLL